MLPSRRRFALLISSLSLGRAAFDVTAADNPKVALKTNMGEIVVELNQEKAPLSSSNFLQYVESGFYNRTIFHRVIDGFMIQGGGFEPGMKQKRLEKRRLHPCHGTHRRPAFCDGSVLYQRA